MSVDRRLRVAVLVDSLPSDGRIPAASFISRLRVDEVLLVRVIRPVRSHRVGDSVPLIDLAEREALRSLEPIARQLPDAAVERIVLVGESEAGELRRWLKRQPVDLLVLPQRTRRARFGIPRHGTLVRQALTPALARRADPIAPFVVLYFSDQEALLPKRTAGEVMQGARAS